MKRKLIRNLLLVLTLVVMCLAVGMTASAEETYTEGYYTYQVENGEATIVGIDSSISGDVINPETLGGYPVTSIGNYIRFFSRLNNVYIQKNIKNIGYDTFYACGVKNFIVDPDNPYYVSVDGVLYSKDMKTLVRYPDGREKCDFVVPASVKFFEHHGCFGVFGKVSFEQGTEIEYFESGFSFASIDTLVVPKSIAFDKGLIYMDSGVYGLSFEDRTQDEILYYGLIGNNSGIYMCLLREIDLPTFFVKIDNHSLYYGYYPNYVLDDLEKVTIRNPKCEIYDSADTIYEGATIYGYKNSTAQAYAEKYNRNFIALECNHQDYEYKFVEANGCNNAYEYYECTTCGDIKDKKELPDTAKHSYNAIVTLPICTKQGFTTYTCGCGDTYISDYVNELGHIDTNGDYKCDHDCGYEFEKHTPEEPEKKLTLIEKVVEWFKNIFDKLFGWMKR